MGSPDPPPDPAPSSTSIAPAADAPRLLARGPGWVALGKPSGMTTHAAAAADVGRDLLAWAAEHAPAEHGDWAPAHRLDRATSGIVLLASDPGTRAEWARAFAEGRVKKVYRGLVVGRARDKGIIRRPLSDARRGKPLDAVTRYRTEERLGGFSLLRIAPETGRKHQIRRHLADLGFPIVGDDRYGPRRPTRVPGYSVWGGRLWLHASRLELDGHFAVECDLPPSLLLHVALLRDGASPPR